MNRAQTDKRAARMRTAVEDNAEDLLSYFRRRVTPVEDAADLVGETMLTVWRRFADLPNDPIRARMWMFGVARRVLANHQRGKIRKSQLAAKLREQLISDQAQNPSRADGADAREAIDALPLSQSELVLLVHGDGFTITEAAGIMSISASTARGRYSAALRNLRITLAVEQQLPERK